MSKENDDWKFSLDEEKVEEVKKEAKGDSALKRARKRSSEKLELEKSDNTKFREGRRKSSKKVEEDRAIKYRPSSIENRTQALLIDLILPAVGAYFIPQQVPEIHSLVAPYLGIESVDSSFIYQEASVIVKAALFILIYLITTIPFLTRGKTLGLKIKTLTLNHIQGGTLTITQAFLRQTIGLIINVGSVVGVFLPFFNKHKRTLHDLMFKSICEIDD